MPFEPKNITKENVLKAIEKIEADGIELKPSTKYQVKINNKLYPPKEVMRYAHQEMNGDFIWNLSGGDTTNKFLRDLGFEIIEKNIQNLTGDGYLEKETFLKEWPIERLEKLTIEEYTNRERSTAFIYWLEAKTTNFGSIWGGSAYKFGIFSRDNTDNKIVGTMRQSDGVYSWLTKYGNSKEEVFEKIKGMILKVAYAAIDDNLEAIDDVDLGNAVKWKIAALYSEDLIIPLYSESILNSVGSELGLSKKDCKTVSKVQRALRTVKGQKSALKLAKEFWQKYADSENELEDKFKAFLQNSGLSKPSIAKYINAIKVVGSILKKEELINNDFYDIDNKEELIAAKELLNSNEEYQQKNTKGKNMYSDAISKYEEFIDNKDIEPMNDIQYWLYAPGEGAMHWDDFYNSGEMGLGWGDLGDLSQYKTKDDIVKALQAQPDSKGSRKNDATANWDFANEIKVGDVVIAKRGRSEFLGYGVVKSDYYFDKEKRSYESRRKMEWKAKGSWKRTDGKTLVLKTLTNITPYPEYVKMIKGLMGIDGEKPTEQIKLDLPKNLILYGPPGTGKTYKLTNEYFELFTERKQVVSLEDKQKELVEKHSWWEVITICMLDLKKGKVQDVLNHPLLQAKSAISETKNVRATIWSLLQTFTKKDCPNVNLTKRRDPEIFWKDDSSVWSVDVEVVKEQLPEIYEDFEWMNYAEEEENLKQRFKTVTFHQSYSYEDFIEGIKPVLETEGADNSDIGYQIEAGIFKKICLEAKNDPNQPYAVFIDEINRGNVASVFGELITLIEADKRTGEKNEISLELPYSKKSFSVPSNLHIIGTMNTADRSVEALDTALRRRFSFVEMIPEPSKIETDGASKGKIDDIDLVKLLSTINERIEVLVDRDHTIGHAFFMNAKNLSDLKAVMADKIIPLLQEYFYGDYHKMELVLGNGFFEKKAVDKVKFAVATDLQFEGEMFIILDAKEMNDNDFKAAIAGIGFNAE